MYYKCRRRSFVVQPPPSQRGIDDFVVFALARCGAYGTHIIADQMRCWENAGIKMGVPVVVLSATN